MGGDSILHINLPVSSLYSQKEHKICLFAGVCVCVCVCVCVRTRVCVVLNTEYYTVSGTDFLGLSPVCFAYTAS